MQKNLLFILGVCAYVRLFYSQDWLTVAAATVITIALIMQFMWRKRNDN